MTHVCMKEKYKVNQDINIKYQFSFYISQERIIQKSNETE